MIETRAILARQLERADGKQEAALEAQLERADTELAPLDEAALTTANRRAWTWWCELSPCRPAGFGLCAIPHTEIDACFRLRGQAPDAYLVAGIRAIDAEFLAHHADERKREQNKTAARRDAPRGAGKRGR